MEQPVIGHQHEQPKTCVMPGCKEVSAKNSSLCNKHRSSGNDLRTPNYIANYGFNNFYKMILSMNKNIHVISVVAKMENIQENHITDKHMPQVWDSQMDAVGKFLRTLRVNDFIYKTGRIKGNVVYAINESLFPKVVVSIEAEGSLVDAKEFAYKEHSKKPETATLTNPVLKTHTHDQKFLNEAETKKIIRTTAPGKQILEETEVIVSLKEKVELLEKQSEDSQTAIKRLNAVIEKLTQVIQKNFIDVQCPMLKLQMDMPKQLLELFKGK